MEDSAETTGARGAFPTTHWSVIALARDPVAAEYQAALNWLISSYWKPVYGYLRRRGHSSEEAKDLTQEFFTHWVAKDLFGRADEARGRFRAFLLSSLDHFVSNQHRARRAKRRLPPGGIVSIDQLRAKDDIPFEPADEHTPDEAFDRAWVKDLMLRTLRLLEQECRITKNQELYELFRQRIVLPALDGTEAPPLCRIAPSLGLTEKQAANRLITARRAYQRLLRKEIRLYASSDEEVAFEVQDLFRILSGR